jgi:hypothetical protein
MIVSHRQWLNGIRHARRQRPLQLTLKQPLMRTEVLLMTSVALSEFRFFGNADYFAFDARALSISEIKLAFVLLPC